MLFLDIETRSQCDLIFHGLRRYAEDESTQIICMAYAFDDGPIGFWWGTLISVSAVASRAPSMYNRLKKFPQKIIDHIDSGGLITAHNAEFERHLFKWVVAWEYGFNAPKLAQWRCSMTQALTNGFAGGLDAMAIGLGLPYRKHAEGARLIREYCAPGHLTEFKPGDADLMKAYNIGDVEIMRAAVKRMRPLTDDEWAEYHLNCRINERGIPIDVDFCKAALAYTKDVAADANEQIAKLTGGKIKKATERKSRDAYVLPKLTEAQTKLLEVYRKGEKKISFDQDHRRYLLADEELNPDVRSLLDYIDNAGSSALKKFAVALHTQVGGRVHNTFVFNGAGRTGRFSGRGLQPHNIRRDVLPPALAEELIADIKADYEIDSPADTMARLLRAMIYREDGLVWVDWSSIEGRVAPWLANSPAGEEKLDLYREGRDVYRVTAARMYGVGEEFVDPNSRQTGKIAELSLQFGGSHNALINMGKKYGIVFDELHARKIVDFWRRENTWAEEIWGKYEQTIGFAQTTPGMPYPVGRVTYQWNDDYLWCRLPSGRLLAYPKPRWEMYTTPWGEERVGPTFQSHHKPAAGEPPLRQHARGALMYQNTVQAVAADILREALCRADDEGLKIVLHCHDEILIEGQRAEGERLDNVMLEQPTWAEGLPIATGGVQSGKRWGK